MTQITKEAIEALEAARAHILDAYRIWQADDVSAVPPPKSGAGAVIAKIDAVRSSPIAVEEKVKALEWEGSRANSVSGVYSIRRADGEWALLHARWDNHFKCISSGEEATFEAALIAAKAAAQSHHDQAIRSVITDAPVDAAEPLFREGCDYAAPAGRVCNKCGHVHTETVIPSSPQFLPIAEVKALEWLELNERNFKASTIIGEYHIQGVEANVNFRLYLDGDEMRPKEGYYRPFDEAKAAAQSDFETRILSALTSSPGKDGGRQTAELDRLAKHIVQGVCELQEIPDPEHPDTIVVTVQDLEAVICNRLRAFTGKDGGQEVAEALKKLTYLYESSFDDAIPHRPDWLKNALAIVEGDAQPASTALVERLTKALSAVNTWAEQRCPCRNEEPNPCPLCGADANKSGDICLSAESTFPRYLLTLIRDALSSARKDGHNANS